jgi:hypothetical protein
MKTMVYKYSEFGRKHEKHVCSAQQLLMLLSCIQPTSQHHQPAENIKMRIPPLN